MAVNIGKEFFSGDVADVLRNFVDEMSIRTQHGTSAIANAATSKAVTFPAAMPDASYVVMMQITNAVTNTPGDIWVSNKTTTGFTANVNTDPGASGLSFAWLARHNTRLNTKG